MRPFTLLIKPSGSDCNLDCKYCFYKSRPAELGEGRQRMSDEILERLIKDYLALRLGVSAFAWQGGEPTLMGLDFYKKAVELQKQYGRPGQVISNSLQTNAILLDDQWCQFLHEYEFLVGISIDGPKEYHDYYRVDHAGNGTFDKVMRAIDKCKEHKVEFNLLTLVNNLTGDHPDELFDFLTKLGTKYLQFIPCVETDPATGKIADFAVKPDQFGSFLCRIFDRWYEYGPQKLSIRTFESMLSFCLTGRGTICTHNRKCDDYIVIEHNGDAFCCDFFVRPEWRLGNIAETPVEELAAGEIKAKFAACKSNLCNRCLTCRHLAMCRGGCLKDRSASGGFDRESYLCQGYKMFFEYSQARFMEIAASLNTPPKSAKKGK